MHIRARNVTGAAILLILIAGCSSSGTKGVQTGSAEKTSSTASCGTKTRRSYIAANTVAWDYAPSTANQITGKPFGDEENTYVKEGSNRIGRTYEKSPYQGYTDATFKHRQARPAAWQHLGTLGPVIQAEVGDTVRVVFKNNTPFSASMHPHGLEYAKSSEGAPYADGTKGADKADDAVPPGGSHTYVWHVPARSGHGPSDGSSVMWMYMGHTHELADTYAGLVGPIIVTRCGMARADGSPKDVDRQFVTMFEVSNENNSLWIDRNIARFATKPATVDKSDDDFVESNLMHSINGDVYDNLPCLVMHKGDRCGGT